MFCKDTIGKIFYFKDTASWHKNQTLDTALLLSFMCFKVKILYFLFFVVRCCFDNAFILFKLYLVLESYVITVLHTNKDRSQTQIF